MMQSWKAALLAGIITGLKSRLKSGAPPQYKLNPVRHMQSVSVFTYSLFFLYNHMSTGQRWKFSESISIGLRYSDARRVNINAFVKS